MRSKFSEMCQAVVVLIWLPAMLWAEDKKSDAPAARPAGELRFTGHVQASATAALSSRVAGAVEKVNADEGDRVKKGDVLIELSAPELKDDLDAAEARLDQARAELELAATVAAEVDAQVKTAAASEAEAARARGGVKVARAGVHVAEAAVRRAQTQVGYTRIIAPFDGVVARRTADVGDTVGPQRQGDSAPLVTVIQVDPVHVVFDVNDRSAARVAAGTPVVVRAPGLGDVAYRCKLARTAGAFNPETGATRAEVVLPNADGKLLPGMFVTIEVKPEEAKP